MPKTERESAGSHVQQKIFRDTPRRGPIELSGSIRGLNASEMTAGV
jgi:hypothetical protein